MLADSSKFGVVTAVSFLPFDAKCIITETIRKNEYRHLGVLEAKP